MSFPRRKLKYVATLNDETLPDVMPDDFEITYAEISDVSLGAPIRWQKEVKFSDAPSRARRIVKDGDILVSTVRTYLKGIARVEGAAINAVVSTGFAALRPRELSSRFLGYVAQSQEFIDEVVSRSVGVSYPAIAPSDLLNILVPVPSDLEQRAIADYLDRETAEIDAFIADCSSMATLLEEKESAFAASLLTRGLNSSVPVVKGHNILWLEGESIPVHWSRIKLGFLLRMKSGDAISSEDIEEEGPYPVFGGGGLRGYTSTWNITGPHVLIGRQGALCGKVFVSGGDAFATEHAIVTYPKVDLDMRWLEGLLRFMNLGQYSQSAAQPGIGVEAISKLYVPVPPLSEQVEIGDSFESHQEQGAALLLELKSAITLAHERRAALISAAVTGQIDVAAQGVSVAEQLQDELEAHL